MATIYQPNTWSGNGYFLSTSNGTITASIDLTPGGKLIYATVDGLALFIATEMGESPDDFHFELADAILNKYGQEPQAPQKD